MSARDSLVSVVIPTHNRAALLERALRSVLSQTYRHLEVIVVDDRSTDHTSRLLEEVRDPRVRMVTVDSRRGVAEARNRGIELASGRFIAFLDDDDEWLPRKVERQLAVFSGSAPPALVYTGLWMAQGTKRRYGVMQLGGEPFERLLSFPGPITTSGFMVDRECVNGELWFDPSVATFEDGELLLRISKRWPIAVIPEPLYVWHHHDGPRLSEPRGQVRARRRIIEKYAGDLATRPRTAAYHYFRLAIAESRVRDWVGVHSSLLAAAAADPSNLRLRLLGRLAGYGPRAARVGLAGYRQVGRVRRAFGLRDRRYRENVP
jgi:glycosyltransferase involved in cell wall biosynthesis